MSYEGESIIVKMHKEQAINTTDWETDYDLSGKKSYVILFIIDERPQYMGLRIPIKSKTVIIKVWMRKLFWKTVTIKSRMSLSMPGRTAA